jgi:anti-sigma factor RsiW
MMSWFRRRNDHLTDDDLSAYIDGQSGRAAAIESHVASCPDCETRLNELREVRSLLVALPRPVASRSFALGAQYAVAQPRPVARRPVFAFAPAVALSLFVALLAIDFAVVSNDGSVGLESRATSEFADSSANTLSKATEEAAQQPAGAPQPATAPQADSAAGAGQAEQPPSVTPQGRSFDESTSGEREAATQDAAPAAEPDNGARDVIRVLEVVAAIGFVVTLAVFLRRRLA